MPFIMKEEIAGSDETGTPPLPSPIGAGQRTAPFPVKTLSIIRLDIVFQRLFVPTLNVPTSFAVCHTDDIFPSWTPV